MAQEPGGQDMAEEREEQSLGAAVLAVLAGELTHAEQIATADELEAFAEGDASGVLKSALKIATVRHHGRGVVLTLAACKAAQPDLNITLHQKEWHGGFPARGIDTDVTCRFLRDNELPAPAVGSTHWLTRRLIDSPATRDVLATVPSVIGQVCPGLICDIQESADAEVARRVVRAILVGMLIERDAEPIDLVRLKKCTITRVAVILDRHFSLKYKSGAPRLPQLAIYALYQCLLPALERYKGLELGKLMRMKSADAKANTVGDIEVLKDKRPVEAVETKLGIPITMSEVGAAMDKVKKRDVSRYYILSTVGIEADEAAAIRDACARFFKTHGCEIIVNGVIETIMYYLRLLVSPDEFIARYADLLASDEDLTYEHREAWNRICNDEAESG